MSVVIFKPDDIGDFVIASGAIRLIAGHHGEENTTLVVKSTIAPLARREFPGAAVVELPWHPRRKGRNRTLANIRNCYPAWRRLRGMHADVAVCLRSARNFLGTFLFLAPRAKRRIAPENVLLRNGSIRRKLLERAVATVWRTELLPYPLSPGESTLELTSHRLVAEASLRREVSWDEIAPRIGSARTRDGGYWLLCPCSSRAIKDYDAKRWLEVFSRVPDKLPRVILVAGGPDQDARLDEFVALLRSGSFPLRVERAPSLPLRDFPDEVASADLVLTVDTAAAHFACAVDVPAVIVDSGNNPGVYGPYGRRGRQIWMTADRRKFGRLRWQETLPPVMVADAVRQALAA